MRKALVLLAAAVSVAGCSSSTPSTATVTVKFHLADYDTAFYGCKGTGGYSDIGPGTAVTVKNGKGAVLGAGTLGDGKASSNGAQQAFCDWSVAIDGVPAGEGFYSAEVGSRGAVTRSEKDLKQDGWEFKVSLGSL